MLPEYLLTSLADSFQDGVCITDQNGRILLVNRKHAENSGMTQAEMLGHSVQDFMRSGKLNPVLNPEIISARRPLTRIQQTARYHAGFRVGFAHEIRIVLGRKVNVDPVQFELEFQYVFYGKIQ